VPGVIIWGFGCGSAGTPVQGALGEPLTKLGGIGPEEKKFYARGRCVSLHTAKTQSGHCVPRQVEVERRSSNPDSV
jgi:hypothetical protein